MCQIRKVISIFVPFKGNKRILNGLFYPILRLNSPSEIERVCSGICRNTDLLDKAKLEKKIASLEGERKSFNRGKRDSETKLQSKTAELGNNKASLKGMTEDYGKFMGKAKKDKDGNILNLITLDGVESTTLEVIGKHLQMLAVLDRKIQLDLAPPQQQESKELATEKEKVKETANNKIVRPAFRM